MDLENKDTDLDPVVKGVEKIAEFAAKTAKELETKHKDLDEKTTKSAQDLNEKMERGFGNVIDRIEQISKRYSTVKALQFEQDDLSALKDAVPERFHKNLGMYQQLGLNAPKESWLRDERGAEAMHAWFNIATKLQLRQYDSDRERLRKELERLTDRMETIYKADMGGVVDTSGGYAVPNLVGNEVLKIIRDASQVFSRARQIPMSSDTLSFPDENTAVGIGWYRTDGNVLTGSEPVFGVKTLTANKLIGRATFSLELLDDSNVAILPFLQSCFAEKMGGELDAQAVEGSGSPFTGVNSATSVNDAAATNGTNGVVLAYCPTGTTKANLVKIFTKAGEAQTRDQGIFVCGPGVYAQIIGLVDSNGQPVVRLGTVEGQPNNTLFGRPIIVSNRMTLSTVGAGTVSVGGLYFGPPSALMFGIRQGLRWDVTDQVNWAKYQADARMVGRFGYVVGVPTAWTKQASIIV